MFTERRLRPIRAAILAVTAVRVRPAPHLRSQACRVSENIHMTYDTMQ